MAALSFCGFALPTRIAGVVAVSAWLAACAGSGMAGRNTITPDSAPLPAATPTATTAPPAPTVPPAAAPPSAAAPAPAAAPAAPAHAPTIEDINTECWMRADTDRRLRDIDARLKAVTKCVEERRKAR